MYVKKIKDLYLCVARLLAVPFILLIEGYQATFSPDHGVFKKLFPYGYCKYEPTCSQYTKEALQKHGVLKGWLLGIWRILRCNPCSKGGVDRV